MTKSWMAIHGLSRLSRYVEGVNMFRSLNFPENFE